MNDVRKESKRRGCTSPLACDLVANPANRVKLLYAIDFLQTSGLATQRAQVIQLGATYLGGANHFELFDDAAAERENTLDALTEAHLANGEAGLLAVGFLDYNSFEDLDALFVAFLDLDVNPESVTHREAGQVRALHFREHPGNDGR